MTINDMHIHAPARGTKVSAKAVLKSMDRAGVEKAALISGYGRDLQEQRANVQALAAVLAECPERLYGLAWIEPRHRTPLGFLEWVLNQKGYRGFKMIPNHWYPYEERILKYAATMARLEAPCLFHSGILYFETFSSRFCRPAYYEELLKVPRFRFALAHISWPWTDECLAFFGQARSARAQGLSTAELFIDITPGTPPGYRAAALKRLFEFGAEDYLLYGTDAFLARLNNYGRWVRQELKLYRQMRLAARRVRKIMAGNFQRFFEKPA